MKKNKEEKDKTEERELTQAELKRKEEFEKLTDKLVAEGYQPDYLTMSVLSANIFALVATLPLTLPLGLIFLIKYGGMTWSVMHSVFAILWMIVLTVVHEMIHGITWAYFSPDGFQAISFGFIAKDLTPYCTCGTPMKKHQIMIGALMPTLFLGVIPSIVAIFQGSSLLMALGLVMILGGGGDVMISFKLLRHKSKSKDALYIDHPYEVGTVVFER